MPSRASRPARDVYKRQLWNEVLASNPHFTVAYRSIGRAPLADGDCRAAMEYLREGDDR